MDRSAVRRAVIAGAMLLLSGRAGAAPPPAATDVLPRFASLASDKVFWREGPTYDHRVLWIYQRKGLPVEIVASYDVWRRVRDADGTVGWVHSSMLSDRRTVVIRGAHPAPLRNREAASSAVIAFAAPGVIAKLESCDPAACEISLSGTEGWVDKKNIWGVNAGEVFN